MIIWQIIAYLIVGLILEKLVTRNEQMEGRTFKPKLSFILIFFWPIVCFIAAYQRLTGKR